jgi:RHS repeat-associated protein
MNLAEEKEYYLDDLQSTKKFIYGVDLSFCITDDDVWTYYTNIRGDIAGYVDSEGNMTEYKYDAWGGACAKSGTMSSTLGDINPFRYRGYIYDDETKMYYCRARYYSPDLQRFISPDPVMGNVGEPLAHNWYIYCRNDPTEHYDPEGTFLLGVMATRVIGALVGAFVGVVSQYVGDIMVNALSGKTGADLFVPNSSLADYGAAALSGAIASTSITKTGAIIVNGVIGGATYLVNCSAKGDEANFVDFIMSTGIGMVGGAIGGSGADTAKLREIWGVSQEVLTNATSPKKIAMYVGKMTACKQVIRSAIGSTFNATVFSKVSGQVKDWVKEGEIIALAY